MTKSKKNKNRSKKKTTWYKQCHLTSPTEKGEMHTTAWIPESFAVKGRVVYFGKKTDKPERFWTVDNTPDGRITGEYLGEHERDYLTQREASDI